MFYTLLLFLAFSTAEAKVIETHQIKDVLPYIDQDTWFLVDLDNCMFQAAQSLGHANWFYDELQLKMQKGMTRDEAIAEIYPLWIKTQKACRVKALENDFIPSLLRLQQKGVVVMGLTHRQPSVAESTIKQVQSLGFDFVLSAPSKDSFIMPAKTPTLYAQGILFVGDYNKKIDLFEKFLAMVHLKPKKVVFIDDKKKNVDELEMLTQHGIEYIGVHYTAIEKCEPVYKRDVAEFQFKFLDQIMSNEAAILLMDNGLE